MAGEMNTHVFRGKGYRLWATMAEGRLREKHMFQHVEGKMSQPLSDREWKEYAAKIGKDVASAREAHENGKKIAFATLASLIDWPILCKFPRAVDPAKLWEALRDRYANDDSRGDENPVHTPLLSPSANGPTTLSLAPRADSDEEPGLAEALGV